MKPRDQLRLAATVIDLRRTSPGSLSKEVLDRYVEVFGERVRDGRPFYNPDDWRRVSYVFDRLRRGGDVLDVGVGAGEFFNMLALSGQFRSVKGVDRIKFDRFAQLSDTAERFEAGIAELPFPDDSFDVVTCMEVLEHVSDEDFETGISELRRVCRGQLVMTVPYREPEPIYRSHLRRFEDIDVLRYFPDATFTLLDRPRMPWLVIEESLDGAPPNTATATGDLARLRRRVRHLEQDNAALRSRKSIRAANWVGRQLRKVAR